MGLFRCRHCHNFKLVVSYENIVKPSNTHLWQCVYCKIQVPKNPDYDKDYYCKEHTEFGYTVHHWKQVQEVVWLLISIKFQCDCGKVDSQKHFAVPAGFPIKVSDFKSTSWQGIDEWTEVRL